MAYEEFDPQVGDVYLTITDPVVKEQFGDLAKDYNVVLLVKHVDTDELGVEFAGIPGWHPLGLLFDKTPAFTIERIYRKEV